MGRAGILWKGLGKYFSHLVRRKYENRGFGRGCQEKRPDPRSFFLSPTPQARQAAIRSLHDDIPFFQPRVEYQQAIFSTKRLLILMLDSADEKDVRRYGREYYERLKQDFQNDLDSIRQALFSFQDRN